MSHAKKLSGIACLCFTVMISFSLTGCNAQKPDANKGFAVVELFTSEGCSSCPPADVLVAKLQNEYNDLPVFIMGYHVDYWDRLGWKDAFSSALWSKRQRSYAAWFHANLYTPQAVVNGNKEFVGSEESVLRNTIKMALQKNRGFDIELSEEKRNQGKINIQYHVEDAPENTSLLLVLVQKTAETQVLSGENRGRKLSHVQVVRNTQTFNLKGENTGKGSLDIPSGIANQNLEVIAILQNNGTGEILSASKKSLP